MNTTETPEVNTRRHLQLIADTRLAQEFSFSVDGTEGATAEAIGCRFWCGSDVVLYATTDNGKVLHREPNRFTLTLDVDDVNSLLRLQETLIYDIVGLLPGGPTRITKGTASADAPWE